MVYIWQNNGLSYSVSKILKYEKKNCLIKKKIVLRLRHLYLFLDGGFPGDKESKNKVYFTMEIKIILPGSLEIHDG